MKRSILICLLLVISQVSLARGLKFEAPTVAGKSNVFSPVEGEVILDVTDHNFYGFTNNTWKNLSATGGSGIEICHIKDVKSPGAQGGTFNAGGWKPRVLNTISGDTSWCSIIGENTGTNGTTTKFTLAAGKYNIEFSAPAFAVQNHTARLYNYTDKEYPITGSIAYIANTATYAATLSLGSDVITISSPKTFELHHRATVTKTGNGFGLDDNSGLASANVYSQVKIMKLQ